MDPTSAAAPRQAEEPVEVVLLDLARLALPDDLLRDLAEHGVAVLLTTDIPPSDQDPLAGRYLDTGLVSAIVNASLVGMPIPEAGFFELCIEFCQIEPERLLLVDNKLENLDAAAALGIRGVLVGDDGDLAVDTVRRLTLGAG